MQAFDHLSLIAQLSATLLGFVAVFLVLSNREGKFSASDRHFIQAFVLAASLALLMALTPSVLASFMAPNCVWIGALVLSGLAGAASVIYQVRAQLGMSTEEAAKIHWGWHFVAWGLVVVMAALFAAAFSGWADRVAMYVAITSLSVILAAWSFVALVFRKFF